MEVHVFIPSPSHFLTARTLISSTQVRRSPTMVAQRVICHRRSRKRKGPMSLSPMLKRLVGQAISMASSSPRILPPPLDLIAEEFLGGGDDGNGRKSGSRGGWGSRWRWSDGWGRRGLKRGLGFWLVVILIGLSLVIVQGIDIDPQLGILIGLGLGVGMMGFVETLTRDYWVLGFCYFGVVLLLGLGLNKEVTSYAGKFLSGVNQWGGRIRIRRRRRRNRKRFLGFGK